MTRYNVFQYKHLKEIMTLLRSVVQKNKPRKAFPGITNSEPPSDERLSWMLLDFDRLVMEKTIVSLCNYIESRDLEWTDRIFESGNRKRTFDRRKYILKLAFRTSYRIYLTVFRLK